MKATHENSAQWSIEYVNLTSWTWLIWLLSKGCSQLSEAELYRTLNSMCSFCLSFACLTKKSCISHLSSLKITWIPVVPIEFGFFINSIFKIQVLITEQILESQSQVEHMWLHAICLASLPIFLPYPCLSSLCWSR